MSMDPETGLPRFLTTIEGDALPDYWGEHEMALDTQDRLDEMGSIERASLGVGERAA